MGLSDLPGELLDDIWANLDTKHDLNSLVQSCRRFYTLFNPLLYRYVIENCCAETSQWAGENGRVDTLQRLIAEGSDAIIHEAKTTPLFTTTEHGREAMMRFLIEKGIDLNMRVTVEEEGWYNAIHVAAKHGRENITRQLLDAGVEVDTPSCYDSTAIVIAASQGHDGLVSLLLERGASVTAKDGFERTALCYAAGKCSLPFFQKLLEKVPKVLLQELLEDGDDLGRTPLSYAAECGKLGVVKLLLEAGADLNGPDRANTPLRVAIEYERDDIIQFLLDKGACPNESQIPRQYAPLPLAADLGHDEAVRMLLEKGADINYVLPWGETPLILAAWKGHYHVVKRLLDAGAPVDVAPNGTTALDSAIRHGHGEIALLLVRRGADRTACSDQGPVTLLSLGVRNNDHELVKLLLEDEVNLEARDRYHRTPLMVAALNARTELARALVKKGADLCAQDLWGRTPLSIAAERGWLGVVLALLDDGTNQDSWSYSSEPTTVCPTGQYVQSRSRRAIDTADEKGRTPLFYGTVNGHPHVVAALLTRGSIAIDLATHAGRTPRSVAEQWMRHPEFSKRDTAIAIWRMFDKPHKAKASTDVVGEVEHGRIISSPFFDEYLDWDLRQRFKGEFMCHKCPALVDDYGERFFCDKCNDDDYGGNVEDGYTLCVECVAEGKHCLDDSHVLQRLGKSTE